MEIRRYLQRWIVLSASPLLCISVWAQPKPQNATPASRNPDRYHVQGYVFAAPGVYAGYSDTTATMHLGGGGEGLLYKGLGLGAEIGGVWALRGSDLLGLFSVDGSYHFSRGRKVSPFLTGGYSLIGGNGSAHLANLGGGVNWWIGERKGIRFEFRDHVYAEGSNRQIVEFRIGFAFR